MGCEPCNTSSDYQAVMISPASGIHRPSNNGAPARQTLQFDQWSIICRSRCQLFVSRTLLEKLTRQRVQTRMSAPLNSRRNFYYSGSRYYRFVQLAMPGLRNATMDLVLFVFLMLLMRFMRDLAQIKLGKKNKNKRLNKRHKDA